MKKMINRFIKDHKGVAAVEFGLTIGFFLMVLFMIFELARISITSAYWDAAVMRSIIVTKNQEAENGDYVALFKKTLTEQLDNKNQSTMAWLFVAAGEPKVDVKYAETIDDLIKENFKQPEKDQDGKAIPINARGIAIARYQLGFEYQFPVKLPFLPQNILSHLFNREFVIVQEQEYGREKAQNSVVH